MSVSNNDSPVIVFTGTTLDAGMIQSLLQQEGIQAFIKNELISSIAPWQIEPGGLGAAKVVVSASNKDQAVKIINDFSSNNQEEGSRNSEQEE